MHLMFKSNDFFSLSDNISQMINDPQMDGRNRKLTIVSIECEMIYQLTGCITKPIHFMTSTQWSPQVGPLNDESRQGPSRHVSKSSPLYTLSNFCTYVRFQKNYIEFSSSVPTTQKSEISQAPSVKLFSHCHKCL